MAAGVAAVLVAAAAAAGFTLTGGDEGTAGEQASRSGSESQAPAPAPTPRALPAEVRGVHVTMSLMSVRGKYAHYLRLARDGLNALEVDVKDENGEVAFRSPEAPLTRSAGTARAYYDPRRVAAAAHRRGLYLIGRVVVFEDPLLSERKPSMAIGLRGGGIWRNAAGLGWTNPYDKAVWKYNVDVAVAAAKAGFDEIMFDYVRFPSDGDVDAAVYRPRLHLAQGRVIASFLRYARSRLEPLGVRVGAAVFGLSATRNLGIGQRPRLLAPYLDVIHPMVYPSHFGPGEYNLPEPEADPGDTVWFSLRDFVSELRGQETRLVPWLQDFSINRTYSVAEIQEEIASARAWQSAGFLLWNASGVYTPEALKAPSE